MSLRKQLLNFNHDISPTPLSDFIFNVKQFFIAKGHDEDQIDVVIDKQNIKIAMFKEVTLAGKTCEPYWDDVLNIELSPNDVTKTKSITGCCHDLFGISDLALSLLVLSTKEYQLEKVS